MPDFSDIYNEFSPLFCIKMLVKISFFIATIQKTPQLAKRNPKGVRILSMFSERNHLQSLFLIR